MNNDKIAKLQNCKIARINKKGFTLSEVLITLAVIGVVAAMVIPAVQTYTIKKTFTSKFLKAYQTLCSATEKVKLKTGGNLDISIVGHYGYSPLMRDNYKDFFNVTNHDTVWYDENSFYSLDGTPYTYDNNIANAPAIETADGMLWAFLGVGYANCSHNFLNTPNTCGIAAVDLNGLKGPNRMGIDIHEFIVTEKAVYPMGINYHPKGACNKNGSYCYNGRACGYFILRDGAMNYLDGDLDNYD